MRHTAVDVPAGTCYGQTDVPLKATFPEEARRCKERLAGLSFDAVFTSPLSRCTRLAEACGFPEAIREARLLEMNFGDWEMQRFEEITDPHLQTWYADFLHVRTPQGESFDDQYERVAAFLEEVKQSSAQRILLFAHGGVLVSAKIYAGVVGREEGFSALPQYGELIKLTL